MTALYVALGFAAVPLAWLVLRLRAERQAHAETRLLLRAAGGSGPLGELLTFVSAGGDSWRSVDFTKYRHSFRVELVRRLDEGRNSRFGEAGTLAAAIAKAAEKVGEL